MDGNDNDDSNDDDDNDDQLITSYSIYIIISSHTPYIMNINITYHKYNYVILLRMYYMI